MKPLQYYKKQILIMGCPGMLPLLSSARGYFINVGYLALGLFKQPRGT
ncbi:hypothetical protein NXV14_07830 [Bacteroides fragilis]|nr:hypothetical protein [Bacteroides fragilis]